MEHLDIVSLEELVPESGGSDGKEAPILDRAEGDAQEDDEPSKVYNIEGKEDMVDAQAGEDIVELEADSEDTEYVVTGVAGMLKGLSDVDVEE